MASRTRDEPVSSILDAMANSGDEPDKESSMAILSSFDNLNEEEKDTVVQDPNVHYHPFTRELENQC